MKKFIIIICVFVCLVSIQGCKKETPVLKSPCVGIENSPCGPRRPVNDWWLEDQTAIS